jgi:dTDP-4-amino-4,6-dideoxygalactose transaminase
MTYWQQRYAFRPDEFPQADRYFAGALSLPLFPTMTDGEVDRVARALQELLE